MFSTSDSIVAIATPPGRGGIGVVRLSGPEAHRIAQCLLSGPHALQPRHATLTTVRLKAHTTCDADRLKSVATDGTMTTARVGTDVPHEGGSRTVVRVAPAFGRTGATDAIDQVVATYFPAPASYTGDDVVEISAHGSPVVLRAIVAGAIASGARLAEPGEFTLRAFLNGRIDLTQAEAIGDLIEAATPLQARAAFDQLQGTLTEIIREIDGALFDLVARLEASIDFPEEGYHFVETGALASALDTLIERTDRLLADGARGRVVREGLQVAIVGRVAGRLLDLALGSLGGVLDLVTSTHRILLPLR